MSKMDQDKADNILNSSDDDNDLAKALSELIDQLGDTRHIQLFTDLNMREIRHLAVLRTVADDTLNEFTKNYMKLKISNGRLGRKELIDVSDSIGRKAENEAEKSGLHKLRNMI